VIPAGRVVDYFPMALFVSFLFCLFLLFSGLVFAFWLPCCFVLAFATVFLAFAFYLAFPVAF
jgi:hypothetical protein